MEYLPPLPGRLPTNRARSLPRPGVGGGTASLNVDAGGPGMSA